MCAFWNIFQLYLFFYDINMLCVLWYYCCCYSVWDAGKTGWRKWGYFFVRGKFNLFTHFKSEKFLTHFSGFLFQHKKRQKLKAIFRQFTIGKVCQYFLNSTSYQSLMLIEHMRYHHMDIILCFIHIIMLDAF